MSTISASTTSTTAYKVTADTTGTLVLQTGSTPTTAVTIGTDQSVTLAGTLAVQSQNISPYTGFKNRIINGAMVIDQRNAGTSYTPTALSGNPNYSLDRWTSQITQASKFTVQRNAGSVTPPAGFINYLGITSSSAYSVGASDYFVLAQLIEGLNIADLGWGTANAQTVTLSFRVYSSLTGTFSGSLTNDGTLSYVFNYTISAANTWTTVSVTIVGPTSGTWLTTNGIGMYVRLGLGCGSSFTTSTVGSWTSGNYVQSTGSTSVVGTNGATFYITGVQLEKGSTATSFDYRPYGTELQLCQRYYYKYLNNSGGQKYLCMAQAQSSSSSFGGVIQLPVAMRATPSAGFSAASDFGAYNANGSAVNYFAGWTLAAQNNLILEQDSSGGSGLVAGNASAIVIKNNGYVEAIAEL
jgi:hypothetical protein